jgi:hypothetical protein
LINEWTNERKSSLYWNEMVLVAFDVLSEHHCWLFVMR